MKDWGGIPYGGRFKLGILGVFVSLFLMVVGIIPPFNRMLVRFPLAWVLAFFILVPSLTVYYDVKEKFWAEVAKRAK
ncbi:MAG: hypothetical protein V1744_03835 [Candidatus Altiarchaeota archaeon]